MSKLNINTLPDNAETKVKHIYIDVSGVKKRCRSVDYHSFDLGFYSADTTIDSITSEAILFAKASMKSFSPNLKIRSINEIIEYKNGMRIIKVSSKDIFNAERKEILI